MAISLDTIERGGKPRPPRLLVYGTKGIGKTTFGASAPKPIFISTEDGMTSVDAPYWQTKTYAEVEEAIRVLLKEEHGFQTAVVDSLDWLEPIVWEETCQQNKWDSIEEPGYGKGYAATLPMWKHLIDGFKRLRDKRDMGLILLAHPEVRRFDNPETEPYDRYQLKLHRGASALLEEAVDAVLFANYRTSTVETEVGFKKVVRRAVGTSRRVLHTEARPAFAAKTRYKMPETLDFTWEAVAKCIPWYQQEEEKTQTAQN